MPTRTYVYERHYVNKDMEIKPYTQTVRKEVKGVKPRKTKKKADKIDTKLSKPKMIYRYFKKGHSVEQIARQYNMKPNIVARIITSQMGD